MTDIHSCSYFCARPECIKQQRDELRSKLNVAELDMDTVIRRCKELESLAQGYLEQMQSDRKQHLDARDKAAKEIDALKAELAAMQGEVARLKRALGNVHNNGANWIGQQIIRDTLVAPGAKP